MCCEVYRPGCPFCEKRMPPKNKEPQHKKKNELEKFSTYSTIQPDKYGSALQLIQNTIYVEVVAAPYLMHTHTRGDAGSWNLLTAEEFRFYMFLNNKMGWMKWNRFNVMECVQSRRTSGGEWASKSCSIHLNWIHPENSLKAVEFMHVLRSSVCV